MTRDALEFKDIFYEDANKLIVEKLKEIGSLLR